MEYMPDDIDEQPSEAELALQVRAALYVFAQEIESKAEQAEADRKPVQDMWVEDLRQFVGQYDSSTLSRIGEDGSDQFNNITKSKTMVGISRLSDMLFPVDGKNYGIAPTPVPDMDKEQAERAAELMEQEIDDQLTECKYSGVARDAIRQACILGTCVIKGPVIEPTMRKTWSPVQDEAGNVEYVLTYIQEDRPVTKFVPVWDYFPDMSAVKRDYTEFEIQRHWMTRKDLAKMKMRDDVMADAIAEVLADEPREQPASYLTELRNMSGVTNQTDEKRYKVWEYHGPVDVAKLMLCGCQVDEDMAGLLEAVIYVCQGRILKANIQPLDTQDRPFSVFCYDEDDACIFGRGIPRLIANPQKAVNGCWRKIDENSGLAVGPQVLVDDSLIEPVPVNGVTSWEMSPKKAWRRASNTSTAMPLTNAFKTFSIESHLTELQAIYNMARQFADDETMVPLISQGESAPHITQTAHGMELLMNAANTMMRKCVKDWDDNITVPLITRFVDWNMQFNKRQEIKGDYSVDAKGTSALLLKETQTRNIFNLMQVAGQNQQFAQMTKWGPLYREAVKAMQLDADKLIKTDEELAQEQQQPQEPPEVMVEKAKMQLQYQMHQEKLQIEQALTQAKLQDAEMERQTKLQVEQIKYQTAMMKLASEENKTMAEIKAELEGLQMDIQGKRVLKADELKSKIHLNDPGFWPG